MNYFESEAFDSMIRSLFYCRLCWILESFRALSTTFDFKFSRLFSENRHSFILLSFTTKVSTLISVEGGEALSRSLNNKIRNIW